MENLEFFKKYLDTGSNEGLRYNDESKSRYVSFKKCLEYLNGIKEPKILELGTCRSFVDGKFEGCNLDDVKYWDEKDVSKWDFGAGCFSLIFGLLLKESKITTVDLSKTHIYRCMHMVNSLNIKNVKHVASNSVDFLNKTEEKYDLIYLDTGDMWPIESTCRLQLEECKSITERDLLNNDGLLLIDDVLNKTPQEMGDINNKFGKSEYSIPYLLDNGYEYVFEGYQYILKNK